MVNNIVNNFQKLLIHVDIISYQHINNLLLKLKNI